MFCQAIEYCRMSPGDRTRSPSTSVNPVFVFTTVRETAAVTTTVSVSVTGAVSPESSVAVLTTLVFPAGKAVADIVAE